MKAYVLLGLALAAPASAQTSTAKSVEEAAKIALDVCVDHARGAIPIVSNSGAQLDAKGVTWQLNPPEFLASTRATVLGIAQYAKSPSTEGEVWAIGYDSGGCMVVTLAAPIADVEKGYGDYFAGAKMWRSERPTTSARPGERLEGHAWNVRRNLKLTALIGLRDEANTTTVTITRGAN
jgi:hypothetical protein